MKILIIGGGITGLLSAYFLSKEGFSVTISEKDRYPSMKTSYANGGQISVSNSQVWNNFNTISQVYPSFYNEFAPIIFRPKFSWDKIKWIYSFLQNSSKSNQLSNTIKNIRLGLRSRELYEKIIQIESINFNKSNSGILHLFSNQTDIKNSLEIKPIYNEYGVTWDILDRNKILEIEPNLTLNDIKTGSWTPEDWVGDIHLFSVELSKILQEKYRVNFIFENQIDTFDKHYDLYVVSAGIDSVKISRNLGDNLLIQPVKGYSLTFENLDTSCLPKVSIVDERKKLVISPLGDTLRIAGTVELSDINYDIIKNRLQPMFDWVHSHLKGISTKDYNPWAGLRPMTPNMYPIIKQSKKNKKVWYNTGHGHLGWTQAAGSAELLVKQIKQSL
jgi:D-amino-acid dehydrogenase